MVSPVKGLVEYLFLDLREKGAAGIKKRRNIIRNYIRSRVL